MDEVIENLHVAAESGTVDGAWAGFTTLASAHAPSDLLLELCEVVDDDWSLAAATGAVDQLLRLGSWACCEHTGRTPLHVLCANDRLTPVLGSSLVALLADVGGVPPDALDAQGDAALHTLCNSELAPLLATAMAHALLDAGASCSLEDADQHTPCSLADGAESGTHGVERGPQPELAEVLRRRLILGHHGCGFKVLHSPHSGGTQNIVAGDGPLRVLAPSVGAREPEPEPQPESEPARARAGRRLRLLIVSPGSGFHSHPRRFEAAQAQFDVHCPVLPDAGSFGDWNEEVEAWAAVLSASIASAPDVMLAGTSGSAVVAELSKRGLWTGPTLLLAATRTIDCIACWEPLPPPGRLVYSQLPLCIYHGTEDEVHRIALLREEAAAAYQWVQLIEAPGENHALPSLLPASGHGQEDLGGARLAELVLQTEEWGGLCLGQPSPAPALSATSSKDAGQTAGLPSRAHVAALAAETGASEADVAAALAEHHSLLSAVRENVQQQPQQQQQKQGAGQDQDQDQLPPPSSPRVLESSPQQSPAAATQPLNKRQKHGMLADIPDARLEAMARGFGRAFGGGSSGSSGSSGSAGRQAYTVPPAAVVESKEAARARAAQMAEAKLIERFRQRLQMGAFVRRFRNHGTGGDDGNYSGSEGEEDDDDWD